MATIKDYYNKMIEVKDGNSDLDELQPYNDNGATLMQDLNSGSKVAIWRLFIWIVAVVAWMLSEALGKHKIEVNNQIAYGYHGCLRYYHFKSLNFQFGDVLKYNGRQYAYLTDNDDLKIIKRCAVSMYQGVMRFKVVKESNGVLESLTIDEETAYKDFLSNILYPGTNYTVISSTADLLKLNIKIYTNQQIINPFGVHVQTNIPVVENAINDFVKNLPFNGKMNIQKLIDAIQSIEGVEDVQLTESSYKYGGLSWVVFTREIEPFSGYMELDLNNSNIEYYAYL